ncbi:uncharacterized protein LOC112520804 [Cynara cardunculus var. scolymus]|uniref:uncharacterized protein LOC112520804 n=1 Tax=Cynara cardunculus var. scolymus TaxID=59895 RepID=UPI000D624DF7|nr:uncharacterized protein LOC112520804 [Cynara cardunculus var. scolymus]
MLSTINESTNEEEAEDECGVEIGGQFNSIHETLLLSIMAHWVTISTATPSPCTGIAFKNSQQSVSSRRDVGLRLVGAVFGYGLIGTNKSADAAARRPPPTPLTEKKDPNISGVLAKVIASKKRKEAMKESMAQLREKGKLINPAAAE